MDKDNINKLDPDENIVVRMGGKVYIYEKGSPEWKDWESIPSYDDAEMVYSLMIGEYVDEFKARIPEYITNIIVEETHPASEASKLLNEAYEIYNNLLSASGYGQVWAHYLKTSMIWFIISYVLFIKWLFIANQRKHIAWMKYSAEKIMNV